MERELNFILARPEKVLLAAICKRLPSYIYPDHLTVFGLAGSILAFVGYAVSDRHAFGFILAVIGLAINWFGDSLDGNLARFRDIERPKYGYYLDHGIDVASVLCILCGLGLSPLTNLNIALLCALLYLAIFINTLLEHIVFGKFELGFNKLGPTEARIILVFLNIAAFIIANIIGLEETRGISLRLEPVVYILMSMTTLSLGARFAKNLTKLSNIERDSARFSMKE